MSLGRQKETGEGRTLWQEIKRIDTVLRTNDRAVLGRVRGIQRSDEKGRGPRESPGARVTEGVSIDNLLDAAGHRFFRSGGDRMKEREN